MIGILESQFLMSYSPRINIPLEWRDLEEEQPAETSEVVPELPDPIGWHLKTPVVAINPLQFRRLRAIVLPIVLIHLWVFLHRAVVMCPRLLVHWLKYRILNRRELCIGFQMVRLLAVRQ